MGFCQIIYNMMNKGEFSSRSNQPNHICASRPRITLDRKFGTKSVNDLLNFDANLPKNLL